MVEQIKAREGTFTSVTAHDRSVFDDIVIGILMSVQGFID